MNSAAPWQERQPVSGRAAEFRMHEGKLQQLGADGTWTPYVPFERLKRRQLKQKLGAMPCDCDKYRGSVGAYADGTQWTCPRCGERYESDDGAWLRVAADPEQQLREIWAEVADLAPALPGPDLTLVREAEPEDEPEDDEPMGRRPKHDWRAEARQRLIEKGRLPAPAPPPPAPAEQVHHQEEPDMQTQTNGTSNGVHRRHYTDEQKRKMAEAYRAAEDPNAVAAELELHPTQLRKWAAEFIGPGQRGRRGAAKAEPSEPTPAKPKKTRPAPPRPADQVDAEFDVLRQLLALPAAARQRIVRYLADRDR